MADLISVIVTTYNRVDALGAVLRGLEHQTDRNFEVVVADDGSGPPTGAFLRNLALNFPMSLKHVWQEDRGFRAAECRNRAILASGGLYCVFLDGDCIPRPDFVAAHRRLAEPGWFVTGNRVLMARDLTERVLAQSSAPQFWSLATWSALRYRRKINRLAPLLPLPLGPLRKVRPAAWRGARSCNLAVWRSDLNRIDGFDASYRGWGLEDSDLLMRLLQAGLHRKDGNFATGVLHLWHPQSDRSAVRENERRLDAVEHARRVQAVAGLSRLGQGAEAAHAIGGARVHD